MEEIRSSCDCDPLYKLIDRLVDRFLSANFDEFDSFTGIKTNALDSISHQNRVHVNDSLLHINSDYSGSISSTDLLRSLFRERCVRRYTSNVFRCTSGDTITTTLTWQFIEELPWIWKNLIDETDETIVPQIKLQWNLDSLQLQNEPLVHSITLPPGKYKNMQINLTPSVAEAAITWTLKNFPRKVVRKDSCRIENCRVIIGASDLSESKGNMPLAQYRKFLIAKFFVRALGKSGYIVDPDHFCALPSEDVYANNLFVVSEGQYGEKLVQRIFVGRVAAKHILPQMTKVYGDITAEYLHNLRLQGVKVVDDSHDKLSKTEPEIDLSWLISAANLTTAKMNYDLLIKDSSSDIELLAVEQGENAGLLLIMYNYARIVSILNKFEEAVSKEEYPPLSPIEMLTFSSLSSKEELDLISFIWEWPRIVERTVDFVDQKFNISFVLKSVKELATRFNNFYLINKVLVPTNSSHNFCKMYARIYMLQACKEVFEEFLDMMQIEFNGSPGLTKN